MATPPCPAPPRTFYLVIYHPECAITTFCQGHSDSLSPLLFFRQGHTDKSNSTRQYVYDRAWPAWALIRPHHPLPIKGQSLGYRHVICVSGPFSQSRVMAGGQGAALASSDGSRIDTGLFPCRRPNGGLVAMTISLGKSWVWGLSTSWVNRAGHHRVGTVQWHGHRPL